MNEHETVRVDARQMDMDPVPCKVYTLPLIQGGGAGDCTMFEGATWTLYPDGHASFDGVVTSSDDNDAWLMWVHILDGPPPTGAELFMLENYDGPPDDRAEFVQNMPDHTQRYRFLATGHFDKNLFDKVGGLRIDYRC